MVINYALYFEIFQLLKFIPMLSTLLKQLKLQRHKISFGRCTITYMNINKHLMTII